MLSDKSSQKILKRRTSFPIVIACDCLKAEFSSSAALFHQISLLLHVTWLSDWVFLYLITHTCDWLVLLSIIPPLSHPPVPECHVWLHEVQEALFFLFPHCQFSAFAFCESCLIRLPALFDTLCNKPISSPLWICLSCLDWLPVVQGSSAMSTLPGQIWFWAYPDYIWMAKTQHVFVFFSFPKFDSERDGFKYDSNRFTQMYLRPWTYFISNVCECIIAATHTISCVYFWQAENVYPKSMHLRDIHSNTKDNHVCQSSIWLQGCGHEAPLQLQLTVCGVVLTYGGGQTSQWMYENTVYFCWSKQSILTGLMLWSNIMVPVLFHLLWQQKKKEFHVTLLWMVVFWTWRPVLQSGLSGQLQE